MKHESHILDFISACVTGGEEGQRDAVEVVREAIWSAATEEGISCCLNTAANLLAVCS